MGESSTYYAVYGMTDTGVAVIGDVKAGGSGTSNIGVIGRVGVLTANAQSNTTALYGQNQATGTGGRGLYAFMNGGTATGTMGIYGANVTNAADAHGIIGLSAHGHGLVGTSSAPSGLYAGLVGQGSGGASAGNFYGNVAVTGNLYVGGSQTVAGAKSAALAHPDGSHRLVYCVEAPDSWLEDVGSGALTNGTAQIKFDPDFAAVADMTDYHVFITEKGDFHTHVIDQQPNGFTVQQTTGTGKGNTNGTFSWRVMAKRKDVKAGRLAKYAIPQLTPPEIAPPHVPDLPTPQPPPKKP
jgi:hypothetical protein